MARVLDKEGQELQPCECVIIAPAEHAEAARDIALAYMRRIEGAKAARLDDMLPTPLAVSPEFPPTHYACHRRCYTRDRDAMVSWKLEEKRAKWPWCALRLMQPGDEDALAKYGVVDGSLEELLEATGLYADSSEQEAT